MELHPWKAWMNGADVYETVGEQLLGLRMTDLPVLCVVFYQIEWKR